jgi:ParB family chromosome partitioning protein
MATAKPQAIAPTKGEVTYNIKLKELYPRPSNGRKRYNKGDLNKLAANFLERQEKGLPPIQQYLLVRPRPEGGFEIVAGWRRWTAAGIAGLEHAPCVIRKMTDAEAAWEGAIENLQREQLDPIDEAVEFQELLKECKSIKELATTLSRDPKFILKRLPLANLIDEAVEDLRARRISVELALLVAQLPESVQPDALAACYSTYWDGKRQAPDKQKVSKTERELREWIQRHILLQLSTAPFKLDDPRLREDGLACLDCTERTGSNKMLFKELSGDRDSCLNKKCFDKKTSKYIQIEALRVKKKESAEPAPIITDILYGDAPEGMLNLNQFVRVEKTNDRCESTERAVWGRGRDLGKTAQICRNPKCPKHAKRLSGYATNGASTNRRRDGGRSDKKKHANRLQELLDINFNDATRQEVFRRGVLTYTHPLSRADLNRIAHSHFKWLPAYHQKTINAVLEKEITEETIAAMTDDELAGFMTLNTHVHHGANEYSRNRVDQREVAKLAERLGLNYPRIDAEIRVKLSKKKHLPAHKLYLEEVIAGKHVDPPNVYGGKPFPLSVQSAPNDADHRKTLSPSQMDGGGEVKDQFTNNGGHGEEGGEFTIDENVSDKTS